MKDNKGYVYVLINPSYEGIVKIGKTTKNPEERAKELSSATGVATPFIVAYKRMFNNCHIAEKAIHNMLTLQGNRINDGREFFRISTSDAINAILNIADDPAYDNELTIMDDPYDDNEDPMYYTIASNYYLGNNGFTKDYNKAIEFYHKSILADEKCEDLIWEDLSEIYEELGNLQLAIKYVEKEMQDRISNGRDSFRDLYDMYHRLFELSIESGDDSKAEDMFNLFFDGLRKLSDEDWRECRVLDDGRMFKTTEHFASYCVWMIEPYIEKDEYQIILKHKEALYKLKREILKYLKEEIIEHEKIHLSNDNNFKILEFINSIKV